MEDGRPFPLFGRDGTNVRGAVLARPNVGEQLSNQAQVWPKSFSVELEEEEEEEEEEEDEEEAGSRAIGHSNLKRKRQGHPQPREGAGPAVPTARHAGHPGNQGGSAGGVHPEAARHRVGGEAAGVLSLPDATAAPSELGDNMGRPVREIDSRDIQATAGAPSRAGNSDPLRNARLLLPSPAPSPPPPAPAALPPAPADEPNVLQPPDPAPPRQAPSPPPAAPEARYFLSWDDLLGAVDDDDEPHAQVVPWAGVIGAPLMPAGPVPSRFDLSEVGPLNFAESPVESYGGHQDCGNGGEEGVPAEAADGDNHEQQGGNDRE
ncbi:unnamed protein product, partial [Ectocarpus sp. 6 AP-2014]